MVRWQIIEHLSIIMSLDILCTCFFFFFNDTATTEIYTLSLHDALPILRPSRPPAKRSTTVPGHAFRPQDRKSTRLNSSHITISYAVLCLKKKKIQQLRIKNKITNNINIKINIITNKS